MNIGDKVYCKKTHFDYETIHTKNKTYTILYVDANVIQLTSDKKDWNNSSKTFTYNKDKTGIFYDFFEYFIPLKEYRKMKLQKIMK